MSNAALSVLPVPSLALEPIFIDSFDSFRTRFGDTDPEKFTDSQIPKYETSFIARSYLSQSNQLFVTRVLGLSGYDAGPSWQLLTVGELDETYVASGSTGQTVVSWTDNLYIPLTGGTLNTSNIYTTYTNGTAFADALSGLTTSPVGGASGPFRTANQITGQQFSKMNKDTRWKMISNVKGFWENLPWMPGAKRIHQMITKYDAHILSAFSEKEEHETTPENSRASAPLD